VRVLKLAQTLDIKAKIDIHFDGNSRQGNRTESNPVDVGGVVQVIDVNGSVDEPISGVLWKMECFSGKLDKIS
jgi:hypothetical protein